jgi:hypothetical protein
VNVPEADAVTETCGSPASTVPLLSMSNQTTPETDPAKPEPETVIDVPGGPLVGLKDIAGVTVNGAEASTGPPDGTSALMLYVPAATVGTVRVAVKVPVPDAVTGTFGSPASSTLSPSMSNQTTPEAPTMKPEPETGCHRDLRLACVNCTAVVYVEPDNTRNRSSKARA